MVRNSQQNTLMVTHLPSGSLTKAKDEIGWTTS
jgi:hypothetical protein